MPVTRTVWIRWLAVILAAALAGEDGARPCSAWADIAGGAPQAADGGPTVSMVPTKKTFGVKEPPVFRVTLKNPTEKAMCLQASTLGYHYWNLRIKDPRTDKVWTLSCDPANKTKIDLVSLCTDPGQAVERVIDLNGWMYFDGKPEALKLPPGRYLFLARFPLSVTAPQRGETKDAASERSAIDAEAIFVVE